MKERHPSPMFSLIGCAFGESAVDFLVRFGVAAERMEMSAYLVGGLVRDLFTGGGVPDLDIVIEGDALTFYQYLSERWETYFPYLPHPVGVQKFPRYKTMKLAFEREIFPGCAKIDLATAREEKYPEPGQAPLVSWSGIFEDLQRRDFAINAMAVSLCPSDNGALCDFFGGWRDIQQGVISVLHEQSFRDDPARLIRAVRFAVRFGMVIDELTEVLFERALRKRFLDTLPRRRLFDEFRKALGESEPLAVLTAMEEIGLLKQLHPGFTLHEGCLFMLEGYRSNRWEENFAELCSRFSEKELAELLKQTDYPKSTRHVITEIWKKRSGLGS